MSSDAHVTAPVPVLKGARPDLAPAAAVKATISQIHVVTPPQTPVQETPIEARSSIVLKVVNSFGNQENNSGVPGTTPSKGAPVAIGVSSLATTLSTARIGLTCGAVCRRSDHLSVEPSGGIGKRGCSCLGGIDVGGNRPRIIHLPAQLTLRARVSFFAYDDGFNTHGEDVLRALASAFEAGTGFSLIPVDG